MDAKLGRRGHVGIHGSLPMGAQASSSTSPSAIHISVVDLETRIRNVYTGRKLQLLLMPGLIPSDPLVWLSGILQHQLVHRCAHL